MSLLRLVQEPFVKTEKHDVSESRPHGFLHGETYCGLIFSSLQQHEIPFEFDSSMEACHCS